MPAYPCCQYCNWSLANIASQRYRTASRCSNYFNAGRATEGHADEDVACGDAVVGAWCYGLLAARKED